MSMESEERQLLGELKGQVGMILPRLTELNTTIGNLFKSVDEVKTAVARFPCEEETRRLDRAEKDIQGLQGCISAEGVTTRAEKLKGSISLRNAIIGGIIIAAVSNIPTIILILTKGG
jgi:hypothetical protein